MKITLQNCIDYTGGRRGAAVLSAERTAAGVGEITISGSAIFPTFCDVHVHLREPGFSYKETIESGTAAAAHGGYSDICPMPNLKPVPDSLPHLEQQLEIIRRDAKIRVYPFGAITQNEEGRNLSDIEAMAPFVIGFSDDGRGVQDQGLMREAMARVRACGRVLAAHCEDNTRLFGGYIHAGSYAALHGHRGISSDSEWRQVERDLKLAAETGCAYHVCHVSTKESVSLIRQAKRDGVDVTCETAPHYLVLDDADLKEDGRFKMNPPLRSSIDRQALLEGVIDGTVDMIATDHAPHSEQEKSGGLEGSLMGVVGLEAAFPVLYTALVREGIIPLDKLVHLMTTAPRRRFNLPDTEDFCVYNLDGMDTVNPAAFLSKGKSTPFAGMRVYGQNQLTVCEGKVVWKQK